MGTPWAPQKCSVLSQGTLLCSVIPRLSDLGQSSHSHLLPLCANIALVSAPCSPPWGALGPLSRDTQWAPTAAPGQMPALPISQSWSLSPPVFGHIQAHLRCGSARVKPLSFRSNEFISSLSPGPPPPEQHPNLPPPVPGGSQA